ncbi:hypothetical protein [Massilia sp. DD77]|uniref:hypothetical protein n=1 Tax=Massilia sp. DD77 TaxID=3109349 RepID=UPI002FFE87A3
MLSTYSMRPRTSTGTSMLTVGSRRTAPLNTSATDGLPVAKTLSIWGEWSSGSGTP